MAQVLHLEQYRLSQEAAKCFDDDLDFCPSLTAKELSEIILASILAQKENQARQPQQRRAPGLSSTSPTTPAISAHAASRAVSIVDPASRTPLYIPSAAGNAKTPTSAASRPGHYAGSTTPATAGLMAQSDSYFNIMPAPSRQQQQQQQLFSSMYGSPAYPFSPQALQPQQHQQNYSMGMTSPVLASYSPPRLAKRIRIVNPDNGSVVSVPDAPAPSPAWHQHHFVAVR